MWPGQGLSLKVKEILYRGKSDFQVRWRVAAQQLAVGPPSALRAYRGVGLQPWLQTPLVP